MTTRDRLYIGGSWVTPSDPGLLEIRSPHDRSVLGHVAQAVPADVDAAVAAARAAFDDGPWPHTSPASRAEVIRRVNALREARADESQRPSRPRTVRRCGSRSWASRS